MEWSGSKHVGIEESGVGWTGHGWDGWVSLGWAGSDLAGPGQARPGHIVGLDQAESGRNKLYSFDSLSHPLHWIGLDWMDSRVSR